MIILGIETSCDETALALIETRDNGGHFECRVISSLVHSQAELHSAYGGVFPSLAKREHGKNLVPLLHKLLAATPILTELSEGEFNEVLDSFKDELEPKNPNLAESLKAAEFLKQVPAIDGIAVTEGPGLEPALWVGINFARVLGALWKIPVIPVNHMEGHIVGSLLDADTPYGTWQELKNAAMPSVALLISGGHTELVLIDRLQSMSKEQRLEIRDWRLEVKAPRFTILGQTKDDAVGEAFDKVARLLGLPYPGGPHIGKMAHEAYENHITSPVKLPRPMMNSEDLNFSFAGLKTAVLYAVQKADASGKFDDNFKKGIAYEFEQAVAEVLDSKLRRAVESVGAKSIIIGGGVSANHVLRQRFEKTASEFNIPIYLPSRHISGDNALMIALAGAINSTATLEKRPLKAQGTKRLS